MARFLYEYILTIFGCPFTIVINQGVHFINDTIKHLTKYFILKHVISTTYYPQGNKQAKSTNIVIRRILTKLINEMRLDWDEHLSTIFFSYKLVSSQTCFIQGLVFFQHFNNVFKVK
jgi:hypothetical protein